jgi:DNA-binding MarR family transcriptional regulator
MKLEDEIVQEKFRNDYHKLAVNIIYTYGWLMRFNIDFLGKFDLTPQQYNILRILRGQYPSPVNINLLKERMLDKMSDASRLVERLKTKGLVDKNTSENDKRHAQVLINNNGLNLLKKIDELDSNFDKTFSNLNTEEAKTLNSLLDKLRG